jgi:hypothetical protein
LLFGSPLFSVRALFRPCPSTSCDLPHTTTATRSAEVLHQTGILDYHDVMEDHHDALTKVKDTCMKQADYFRVSVRNRLNPAAVQAWIEQEKMAAMGLASGALVGLVL